MDDFFINTYDLHITNVLRGWSIILKSNFVLAPPPSPYPEPSAPIFLIATIIFLYDLPPFGRLLRQHLVSPENFRFFIPPPPEKILHPLPHLINDQSLEDNWYFLPDNTSQISIPYTYRVFEIHYQSQG